MFGLRSSVFYRFKVRYPIHRGLGRESALSRPIMFLDITFFSLNIFWPKFQEIISRMRDVDFRGLFKIWSFWGCLPPQFRLTVKSFWPKPENFLSLLVLSRWLVIIFFAKMSQKCEIRKFSFMFFFQILIIQAYSDPSLGSWWSQRLDPGMG